MNKQARLNRINELVKQNLSINVKEHPYLVQRNRDIIKKIESLPNNNQDTFGSLINIINIMQEEFELSEQLFDSMLNSLKEGKKIFQLYGTQNSDLNYFIEVIKHDPRLKSVNVSATDLINYFLNKNSNDIHILTEAFIKSNFENLVIILDDVEKISNAHTNLILNFFNNSTYFDEYLGLEMNLNDTILLAPIFNKDNLVSFYEIAFFKEFNHQEKIEKIKQKSLQLINKCLKTNFNITLDELNKFTSILFDNNLDNIESALKDYLKFLDYKNIKHYTDEYFDLWDLKNNYKLKNNELENIEEPGVVNIIGVNQYLNKANISKIIVKKRSGNEDKILMKSDEDMSLSVMLAKEIALEYLKKNDDQYYFTISTDIINSELGGNSAGLSLTVAIVSLLSNRKISDEVAFTGSVTLSGQIKSVGGIDLKLIACSNAGIKKVFIPLTNFDDYLEIKNILRKDLEVIAVKNFKEVFKNLFIENML